MRKSRRGKFHPYTRKKQIAVFQCDNCNELFERDKGVVDPRRLSNNYFHVCPKCDPKRFAQRKGVEQRKKLNLSVNTDIRIDEL